MHGYFVRQAEVPGYHPANHTGTTNYRLIGPDTVGARKIEVILGVIEPGQGALPHRHPGIEQQVLARQEIKDKLANIGFEVAPMGPEAFGDYIRQQVAYWGKMIKAAGIQPE